MHEHAVAKPQAADAGCLSVGAAARRTWGYSAAKEGRELASEGTTDGWLRLTCKIQGGSCCARPGVQAQLVGRELEQAMSTLPTAMCSCHLSWTGTSVPTTDTPLCLRP